MNEIYFYLVFVVCVDLIYEVYVWRFYSSVRFRVRDGVDFGCVKSGDFSEDIGRWDLYMMWWSNVNVSEYGVVFVYV